MCGGTRCRSSPTRTRMGLSPRVRGNQGSMAKMSERQRSIPACAGEPSSKESAPGIIRVYPRVCGGTHQLSAFGNDAWGLSPRVRGNQGAFLVYHHFLRSIPACAGEPLQLRLLFGLLRVYPRVCGGTLEMGQHLHKVLGLSPRVRGNREYSLLRAVGMRSIPACAGEPRT